MCFFEIKRKMKQYTTEEVEQFIADAKHQQKEFNRVSEKMIQFTHQIISCLILIYKINILIMEIG
jgi:hypothetical protein